MKLGKEIALEAKKNNLCQPWFKEMLLVNNYSKLADMYFKGDDWAMEKDFPGQNLLQKHKGGIMPYGLIIDAEKSFSNVEKLAFFGNSSVNLDYSAYSVSKLIIRHNSKANIKVKDNAILSINILDNASVDIECRDDAKVFVFAYSDSAKVKGIGNVVVKQSKFK